MKRFLCCLAVFAVFGAQFATADVLDFQDLEHIDDLLVDVGVAGNSVYTSGPWMVSGAVDDAFPMAHSGTLNGTFYQDSTMLFNNTIGGTITLERTDGGVFDFKSIDIATLFVGGAGTSVDFVSNNGDVSSFATPDGNGGYTHSFGSDFDAITSVSWVQDGAVGFHQFDNITVNGGSIIPEPSSCVALALAGMAIGVRRRKK